MAPATLGPSACPIPKKRVTKPNAAGVILGLKRSPHAAAMIAGMLQAESPKRTAERVNPGGAGQRANRPKATAWVK